MVEVRLQTFFRDEPLLVTRESAHLLDEAIENGLSKDEALTIDFHGIQGIAPSFFDELMGIIEQHGRRKRTKSRQIRLKSPPTPPSRSLLTIINGRGMTLDLADEEVWILQWA